jgi:hypothetical protein
MQQNITIKYNDGTETTYQVRPPDYARWELTTKKVIAQFGGMWDILYVAHSAMMRAQKSSKRKRKPTLSRTGYRYSDPYGSLANG